MTDRYTILGKIAEGGMASVHLGRTVGSAGFSRLVAIKRLRAELATDKDFVAMLLDEARVTAQIRHTNVVDTLDLISIDGVLSLVLEYVEGDALHAVVRQAKREQESVPRPIAVGILIGILRGLDAAHNTRGEDGTPLGVVHRDISPQNVLVGVDGVPRIIDFGIAKAMGRSFATRPGEVRGKFSYMAPEQLLGHPATRQVDVYAAGVVFWELLTGRRLFAAEDVRQICAAVLRGQIPKPSSMLTDIPPEIDDIVRRATAHSIGSRYLTAQEFLDDLSTQEAAPADEIGAWVRRLSADRLAERQKLVQSSARVLEAAPLDVVLRELGRSSAAVPAANGPPEDEWSTVAEVRRKPEKFEPPSLRSDEIGTSVSVRAEALAGASRRGKSVLAALLTLFALGLSWAGLRYAPASRHAGTVTAANELATTAGDAPGEEEPSDPSTGAATGEAIERAGEDEREDGVEEGTSDRITETSTADVAPVTKVHRVRPKAPRRTPSSTSGVHASSPSSHPAAKEVETTRASGKTDPRSFR